MKCPQCQHDNADSQKFCGECGSRLILACPACQAVNPPTNKFCGECGARLGGQPAAPAPQPTAVAPAAAAAAAAEPVAPQRFASPASYTPRPLADKILTSRSA